jgi:GNAT superfamily N-acetyltransferase
MQLLPRERYSRAAELYAAAMQADPLHVHFFPDPDRRLEQLRCLYRFKLAAAGGTIYSSSPAVEGCAIWVPPGKDGGTRFGLDLLSPLLRLLAGIPLAALRKMMRYDRFCRELHHALLPAPHWYLDVIAVAPACQGQGVAGGLIRPILEKADTHNIPCALETQNRGNIPIYERFGFHVLREVAIPKTTLSHFFMLRPGTISSQ